MTWLLWRQHRAQLVTAAVALALFALAIAITGPHMADTYRDAVTRCHDCVLVGSLFQGYGAIIDLVNVTVALPLVLGIVFGTVLIARETEHATHVLAWTQTVTRRQWVLTKVGVALSATMLCATAATALVTWWAKTPNALYANRFDPLKFDTQNLMPVAFAVFAVGLGVAAGAILRRSLAAIAVTAAGYLAIRLPVEIYLRPHYQPPAAVLTGLATESAAPHGAWVLNGTLLGPNGRSIHGPFDPKAVCPYALDRRSAADCLNSLGYHLKTTFQPASRYWRFQWTEAVVFTGIGLALLAVAVLVTLLRDA